MTAVIRGFRSRSMKKFLVIMIMPIASDAIASPVFPKSEVPLRASQAFSTRWETQDNDTLISWAIDPCCKVYASRIKVEERGQRLAASRLQFSRPPIEDAVQPEGFRWLYTGAFSLAVSRPNGPLTITFQGCNNAGFCYPPQVIQIGAIEQ